MNTYPKFNIFQILTYPLSLSPFLMIFFTALFISGGLMDIMIAVVSACGIGYFSLWFLKYSFYILTHTAEGYDAVPLFTDNLIRPFEDFRPIKLIIIFIVHITIYNNILSFDLTLGYFYIAMVLFLLPAIISELAMENSLIKTFNPNVLVEIIKFSGIWYWASFTFYCLATLLVTNIYKTDFGLFISVFIALYSLMVSFRIIGLTLYKQRKKMGYATVHSPEQTQQALDDDRYHTYQHLLTNIYAQHRKPSTIDFLEKQLLDEPHDAYDWFLNEIMSWDIKPKFRRLFVQLYCRHFCENGDKVKAFNQYVDYSNVDIGFMIEDRATQYCLLTTAIQKNHNTGILTLSKSLLHDNKEKTFYKETLITLIKYFTETRPNDRQASTLLRHLVTKFPEMRSDKLIQQYEFVLNT